jgi:hypothetical protein
MTCVQCKRKNFQYNDVCAKCTLGERPSIFVRGKPIILSERTLHKDYYRKGSVEKISGCESQGALLQGELIGGKPHSRKVTLTLSGTRNQE